MMYRNWRLSSSLLAVFLIGIVFGIGIEARATTIETDFKSPPVTSPATATAGIDLRNMETSEIPTPSAEMKEKWLFENAIQAGLVRPATDGEIEALKAAWKDNERIYNEIIKPYYEKRGELLAEMQAVIPVGYHWQDPATKLVFETVIPDGKMVTFEHYGIKRTPLEGESGSGKLSKKRANELGYDLS